MGKKILIFDDNPAVRESMQSFIKEVDPSAEVVMCRDSLRAKYILQKQLENKEQKFDLYILDLNVSTLGLSSELARKCRGGLLTGWIFLVHVLREYDSSCMNKAVLLSDYTSELEEYLARGLRDEKLLYEQLRKNNAILRKSGGLSSLKHFILTGD